MKTLARAAQTILAVLILYGLIAFVCGGDLILATVLTFAVLGVVFWMRGAHTEGEPLDRIAQERASDDGMPRPFDSNPIHPEE